ncbi:MAG TPA: DUF3562 domain-containing protein [Gammaproteobacteria bacterium]|nr:DUF3562 domain-containing protein [Gammaproteobacteria bacterium]
MTTQPADSVAKDIENGVEQLIHESHIPLTKEDVESIYREEYARLRSKARLTDYLYVLTHRAVMKRMRQRVAQDPPASQETLS